MNKSRRENWQRLVEIVAKSEVGQGGRKRTKLLIRDSKNQVGKVGWQGGDRTVVAAEVGNMGDVGRKGGYMLLSYLSFERDLFGVVYGEEG